LLLSQWMGVRDLDSEFSIPREREREREREKERESSVTSPAGKKVHGPPRDRIYDKTRRSRGLIVSLEKQAPTLTTKLMR